MQIQTGQPYVFGPFALSLPDGWSAEFDDGIHEVAPPDGDYLLQISGYAKDDPVTISDLEGMATDQSDGAATTPIDLPSGLDGLTFDTDADDHVCRFWLIRQHTSMIAVTLTVTPEDLASAAISAQMVVSSIRPSGE